MTLEQAANNNNHSRQAKQAYAPDRLHRHRHDMRRHLYYGGAVAGRGPKCEAFGNSFRVQHLPRTTILCVRPLGIHWFRLRSVVEIRRENSYERKCLRRNLKGRNTFFT